MVDLNLISFLVFVAVCLVLIIRNRKNLEVKGIFILFKTKFLLHLIERVSKYRRLIHILLWPTVILGFIGLVFTSGLLIKHTIDIFLGKTLVGGVAPVLPFKIPGIKVITPPFFFWIVSIAVLVIVHEVAHGVVAKYFKLRLKSAGVGLFALILPLAYVEPEEEDIQKAKLRKQLGVFAAGSFSNFLFGFLFLGLFSLTLFGFGAVADNYFTPNGALVGGVVNDSGAFKANLTAGDVITYVDGKQILGANEYLGHMKGVEIGDAVKIKTALGKEVEIVTQENEIGRASVGIYPLSNSYVMDTKTDIISAIFTFIARLFYWLYLFNLGVGAANLLPLPITDGGLMVKAVLGAISKKWKGLSMPLTFTYLIISFGMLAVLIINIFPGIVKVF